MAGVGRLGHDLHHWLVATHADVHWRAAGGVRVVPGDQMVRGELLMTTLVATNAGAKQELWPWCVQLHCSSHALQVHGRYPA